MDDEINMQSMNNTLIPGNGDHKEQSFICSLHTTVYVLSESHVDKIQPVDAGHES